MSMTVPEYFIAPGIPTTVQTVNFTIKQNGTGSWLWCMNNGSFRGDYNDPTLLLANRDNDSYPYDTEWNLYNMGSNASYRFIVNNESPAYHPMHFHGHNMFILVSLLSVRSNGRMLTRAWQDVGVGVWDGETIINPANPQCRDVQMLPANGYMVWQVDADNPGTWPFQFPLSHCMTSEHWPSDRNHGEA
jgi:FtsP/CotA-like multicopper oxidase with cupredoxin domain